MVFDQLLLTSSFLESGVWVLMTQQERGHNFGHRDQTSCILLPCDISKKYLSSEKVNPGIQNSDLFNQVIVASDITEE